MLLCVSVYWPAMHKPDYAHSQCSSLVRSKKMLPPCDLEDLGGSCRNTLILFARNCLSLLVLHSSRLVFPPLSWSSWPQLLPNFTSHFQNGCRRTECAFALPSNLSTVPSRRRQSSARPLSRVNAAIWCQQGGGPHEPSGIHPPPRFVCLRALLKCHLICGRVPPQPPPTSFLSCRQRGIAHASSSPLAEDG